MPTIRQYSYEQARDGMLATFLQHWNDPVVGWQSVSELNGEEPELIWANLQKQGPPQRVTGTWVRSTVEHFNSEHDSFGENGEGSFQATGVITLQLFVPLDKVGLILADKLGKVIQRAYRGKTGVDEYCGIVFRRARLNEIGPDDRWYNVNILVDFEYDEET